MKLNLGAGHKLYPGFLNVDHDPKTRPDFLVDLEAGAWPFPDNSVTEVRAHHVLEHLGDPGFFTFLQELYRVCEDGAIISIRVPHHRHDTFLNDPTHRRPITVEGLRMFSKKFNQLCIDDDQGDSTLGLYYNVDFELVHFNYLFDPMYQGLLENVDSEREQQIQTMIRQFNNVIMETEIDLMVVKND